jgi:sialidase-1
VGAEPPTRTVVFERGEGLYHTYRIPSIIAAANGELVALCEGRKSSASDAGDIDLVCRRSSDGGQTWGPLAVVWDDGLNTCGNPCPVLDRSTGDLCLLMTHNLGDDREQDIIAQRGRSTRTVWLTSSDDHGATWSPPREITAQVKSPAWTWYATGPGAGIQIERGPHAGRLVIPCDHNEAGSDRRSSHAIYSDDHGATWAHGQPTPRDGVNECEVVEITGGRLLLNMRNYDRPPAARQRAVSDNGGVTWTEQRHDPALVEPICQASIRRIAWPTPADVTGAKTPGVILFSNPADAERRARLTIRMSTDDGETWPQAAVLHEGAAAYSCLVALGGEQVGCLYEADDYERILLARFTLEWVRQAVATKE